MAQVAMDDYTRRHMETWLTNEYNDQERDAPRALLIEQYEQDPEYWGNAGWRKCLDEAERRAEIAKRDQLAREYKPKVMHW